jgi:hypothetical protein
MRSAVRRRPERREGGPSGRFRGGRGGRLGRDRGAGTPDASPHAGAESGVAQEAAGPAHGHRATKPQTAGDLDDSGGEPLLGAADDSPRDAVAAARGPERGRSGRGHAGRRIRRRGQPAQATEIAPPGRGAEPRAADPERRTVVAQERAEAAGTVPAAGNVPAERDGAGACQQEDTRYCSERPKVSGLDIGHDPDGRGQGRERSPCLPALGSRPHAPGRDDEGASALWSEPQGRDHAADHHRQRAGRRPPCESGCAAPTPPVEGDGADPAPAHVHSHRPAARRQSSAWPPGAHAAHSALRRCPQNTN